MPSMDVINVQEKFGLFSDHWTPKRIGELNGQQILLAKIQGEFVFHKHDNENVGLYDTTISPKEFETL